MANKSDYVPFATGTGAAVLSAAAYAALAARQVGFSNGVADPTQVNTVWRQASVVAAMIAKFTADYGPGDVVDDGNVSTLEGQFLAALQDVLIQSPAPGTPYEGTDTGSTANAVFVSTTNPASGALAANQVFIITKSPSGNTGPVTFKNGTNNPVPVKYPDGSDLFPGDWPANGPVLLYIESIAGNLIATCMTMPRLNFPGLPNITGPADGDLVPRYDISSTTHAVDTFADFAAAVLAKLPATTTSITPNNVASYSLASSQNIGESTWTTIAFSGSDPVAGYGTMGPNGVFRVTKPGFIQFKTSVTLTINPNTSHNPDYGYFNMRMFKNGSVQAGTNPVGGGSSGITFGAPVGGLLSDVYIGQFAVNDTFRVQGYSGNFNGTSNGNTAQPPTTLQIIFLNS